MFKLRVQRPDETDYERWWLAVVVASAGLAFCWLKLGAPGTCWFHAATGLPCLTCGGTRCLHSLAEGRALAAFGWNPLVFLGVAAAALFAIYAVIVTTFRLPRLRLGSVSKAQLDLLRVSVALVLAANWLYLVFRLGSAA